MNRVSRRASALLLLILLLAGGITFFLYEYITLAPEWIVSPGSPHVFNSTNIGTGQVVDRDGTMLLDITGKRSYAESTSLRKHQMGNSAGGYGYQIEMPGLWS